MCLIVSPSPILIIVFHISGVCAKALPEFPLEYEGAAPCCAALQEEYDVKVIEL
jgi:hypothetical protein